MPKRSASSGTRWSPQPWTALWFGSGGTAWNPGPSSSTTAATVCGKTSSRSVTAELALGLPCAILFFAWEQRKERDNEEEEQYQLLSDAYNDFLKVVLAHPDLQLRTATPLPNPTPEQLKVREGWLKR